MLIQQLTDSKSANRRSAAKKIRKSGDPDAGNALLSALKKELGDERTWETQYQMIMALGYCLHTDAIEFLESLSKEGRFGMVQMAIGDALFRLSGGASGDLSKALEFIERGVVGNIGPPAQISWTLQADVPKLFRYEEILGIAFSAGLCDDSTMNLSILQHELESLPPEQQDRLSAFLTSLRMRREGIFSEVSRRLDDKDPKSWTSWDAVKAELDGESDEENV